MSEKDENNVSSSEDEWPEERSVEDILTEAEEKHQLISSAKEEAEKGGWVEPQTAEDYLMWFNHMIEEFITDCVHNPSYRSIWLSYIHEIAGYITELRCFCIQPSPKPWECGVLKVDPEIIEGVQQIDRKAKEYARISGDYSLLAHPNFYLRRKKAEFEELSLRFEETTQLVHNVVEQLSYVAMCYHQSNPLQKVDLCQHLKELWQYADLYASKPKELMGWAISIWNYRLDQARKKQPISVKTEYEVILSLDSEKIFTFNSPIEEMFWKAWKVSTYLDLVPQHKIGNYRVDFAHLSTKVVIELDGLKAHGTTEQIAYDRRRQREIEAEGWKFIRFGGKEIHHNVNQSVAEAEAFISRIQVQKEKQS